MHEVSIVSQLIETVLAEVKKRGGKKILEVEVEVGELSFLNVEQMRFAYSVLSAGTLLEGSNLTIKVVSAHVKCQSCGFEGNPSYQDDPSYHISKPIFLCPVCGNPLKVIEGIGCTIKRIKFQV